MNDECSCVNVFRPCLRIEDGASLSAVGATAMVFEFFSM